MSFRTKLFSWLRENKPAVLEIGLLFVLWIVLVSLLTELDFLEKFYLFSRQHETWELDDTVLTSFVLGSILLALFFMRRWYKANNLLRAANTDILTGLFNRRKGWEVIDIEIARARRYQRPLSIILFDLDHFKNINDTHGHLVGDQVLNLIANLALKQLRTSDVLIRWGGEEFLIVCAETMHVGALHLAERLRKIIETTPIPNVGNITASFGVAELKNHDDFNKLFSRVDAHLYTAKHSGRNTVV